MNAINFPNPSEIFTARRAGRFVVTSSVRFVVMATLNTLVPAETKTQKVRRFIGSYVLAELFVEKAKEYFDSEVDDILKAMKELESEKS